MAQDSQPVSWIVDQFPDSGPPALFSELLAPSRIQLFQLQSFQLRYILVKRQHRMHAGSMAPVVCSSYYCPPECAHAHAEQQQSILVHPSIDIWSLGVLALELLSHVRDPNRARPSSPGVEPRSPPRIVSALGPDFGPQRSSPRTSGRTPGQGGWLPGDSLPWEGSSLAAEEAKRGLGQLQGVVLSCVHRDSAQRPSAGMVLAAFEKAHRDSLHGSSTRV